MKIAAPNIVSTSDGSHTLYHASLDEHYHSVHGAIQESRHVFIEAGLKTLGRTDRVSILEVGFGTGLNALLTLLEDRPVEYTALEAFPLSADLTKQLNYPELLGAGHTAGIFELLHSCEWNKMVNITTNFSLQKLECTLQRSHPGSGYHLIYFDAFAPTVQPELWTKEIFDKMFNALQPGGILVTYCAKGEVKRNMKAAGFKVEALQGPPGKREMTRAWKMPACRRQG